MTPSTKIVVEDACGPDRYTGFFELTDGSEEGTPAGGYLYISDNHADTIIRAMKICGTQLDIEEKDVRVLWSTDETKCGVEIWGRMRGVIDIATGNQIHTELENRRSSAVTDQNWLQGFDHYLDQHVFIRARQRFWKAEAQYCDPNSEPKPESETPPNTNFIVREKGPDDLFAVFEDDGSSGYLYLYDSKKREIAEYLHNYDRSEKLVVMSGDVEVAWSDDGRKCGAIIWGKMRGIIDRQNTVPGRVWLTDRDSPGVTDEEWLKGFEYLYS